NQAATAAAATGDCGCRGVQALAAVVTTALCKTYSWACLKSSPKITNGIEGNPDVRVDKPVLDGSINVIYTTAVSTVVPLSSGSDAVIDVGLAHPASISGVAYRDDNHDGVRQSAEPGLSGR